MAKNENKTQQTDAPVEPYFAAIEDPDRARQVRELDQIMRDVTRRPARMWGSSIVGYGRYHYRYDSGREGDYLLTGFASRAKNLTVYIMPGFDEFADELAALGPHKLGKSCLYLSDPDKIDKRVLKRMLRRSVAIMRKRYRCE